MARELNITSEQVIRYLKLGGEFVKSASSTITPPAARAVRQRHQTERQRRARLSLAPEQRPPGPRRRPTGQPSRLQSIPSSGLPRDQDDPLDLAALLFDRDRHTLRPAPKPRPPRGQTYEPLTRWRQHLFSDVEERAWTSRGINDPDQAFLLVEWGLTPRMMDTRVDGNTVAGWLKSGEGPGSVVARLRARGLMEREA